MLSLLFQYIWGQATPGDATGLLPDKFKRMYKTPKGRGSLSGCPSYFQRSARDLHHPKEVQYDEYDGDNDQNMDPTACLWESWTYVPTEKAEQPQYY